VAGRCSNHAVATQVAALLLLSASCSPATESQRYRGDYTFGHEVNIFCPQINTQCYWLAPDTSQAVEPLFMQLLSGRISLEGRKALLLENSNAKFSFKKHDWR
jgi:hypothetical protein